MTALSFENLVSGYGTARILEGVSGDVERGEIVAVLGRNGVGKTTLVRTILGLIHPASGRVSIDGWDATHARPDVITQHRVASALQDGGIFRELTVDENLALVPRDPSLLQRRADLNNELPILSMRGRQRAGTLSGGEQKMLVLARALLSAAQLLILDEITEGVQPSMLDVFRSLLWHRANKAGSAILLVEQNLGFALSLANRVLVLDAGRVVHMGNVEESTSRDIEQFLVL